MTSDTIRSARAPRKILIAEDEPSIVLSLEFLLREAGYEVVVARDGTQALALAEAVRPDLILLDVMLPALNGFDVCRRLRDGGRDTRVLMLTARGRESEIEKGMSAGADAYMTKPFATKELVSKVAELLAKPAG